MEIEELLKKVTQILKNLDIPYLITGGIAVTVWGKPRATFDIDIIVELKEPKISSLIKSLKLLSKAGYVDKEAVKTAILKKGEFNFICPETGLKVDFWIKKDDSFTINEFSRRISKTINKQKIYFISPENLILSKLLWYKESKSSRHLEDIESITTIQKNLDLNYLKKWAKKQSTSRILEKILKKIKE